LLGIGIWDGKGLDRSVIPYQRSFSCKGILNA
jgi:hypothetical protein